MFLKQIVKKNISSTCKLSIPVAEIAWCAMCVADFFAFFSRRCEQVAYLGHGKEIEKHSQWSQEKYREIRRSVGWKRISIFVGAGNNCKIFPSKTLGKIVNYIKLSQDENAKFVNRPRKLSQKLIINTRKKSVKFSPRSPAENSKFCHLVVRKKSWNSTIRSEKK